MVVRTDVCVHPVSVFAGSKKGRGPTLTHSQTWSGEQMQGMLQQVPPPPTPPAATVRTKLQLVDLAGSECVGEYSIQFSSVLSHD